MRGDFGIRKFDFGIIRIFWPPKIGAGVHGFYITDFNSTSFTVFYKQILSKIDPFMVSKRCHHLV